MPFGNGEVAVVTGAALGIGAAIAERLLAEGCRVCAVDRDAAALAAFANRLGSPDILTIEADVSSEPDAERYAAETVSRFGRLDLLVNNAGILGESAPLAEMELDAFERVMNVNLRGTWLGMRAGLRRMLTGGRGGAIVNVASIGAWRINPKRLPYAISKGGIMTLTQGAALEYASHSIRINAVAPGMTDTPMSNIVDATRAVGSSSELAKRPIARKAEPREIANLVAWLLSSEASYVNGAVYQIDGGAISSW